METRQEELVFREMRRRDVAPALELRTLTRENAVSLERLAELGITQQSVERSLQGSAKGWVCEDADQVVAFVMAAAETGEVLVLAMLPRYEGRGIGRRLLDLATDWLFAQGHQELWLLENPDPSIRAFGFYRHLGWRPTGEYRAGEQILKLCRK